LFAISVYDTSSLIARRGRPDSEVLSSHFAVNFNSRLKTPLLKLLPAIQLLPAILPVIAVPGLLSFSSRLIVLLEAARVVVGSSEVGSSGREACRGR